MTDRFASNSPSYSGPATHAFTITPNDSADLSETTRGLYCGSGGAVAVIMMSGQTVTFSELQAGTVLPVRVNRVLATGTTATSLAGLV